MVFMRPMQDNESPVQAIHSNGRLMSDPSSAESYHQTRRTAESDPGHPSMGPADVRQSAGANYQHPQAAYLPHLGSINEQAQLPYAARDYYPDVSSHNVLFYPASKILSMWLGRAPCV